MNAKNASDSVSSGVEALIERLREEGVARGQAEAERVVRDAETRAEWIVRQAQEEAEAIRAAARQESERLTHAGEEALRVAVRDALLGLKGELTRRFGRELTRLIGAEMGREEFLRALILEVAGRVAEPVRTASQVEVLLPRDVVGFEELSRNPAELSAGRLTHFTKLVAAEMLREGVTFGVAEDGRGGLRLRLTEEGIDLDLTDHTVASILLEHLQPRFRALLEGIVR